MFAALAMALATSGPASRERGVHGFIPTSDLVHLLEPVARGLGYDPTERSVFLDAMADNGQNADSLGIYRNNRPEWVLSVDRDTGQVYDPYKCTLFRSPKLARFAAAQQRATGAPPLSAATIAVRNGCRRMRVVRLRWPALPSSLGMVRASYRRWAASSRLGARSRHAAASAVSSSSESTSASLTRVLPPRPQAPGAGSNAGESAMKSACCSGISRTIPHSGPG
jgi:hypothetical protein